MPASGWTRYLLDHVLSFVLVAICLALSIVTPNFLTVENLLNVLRQVSMQGIIAFGMTMLIVCGEIDLSVGSGAAFAGCLMALLTRHMPLPLAFPLVLAAGFGVGAFTGMMRTRYGVSTFITTLALMTGLRGGALMITGGFPLTPFPKWYNFLGGGYLLGVPVPALIFVATFASIHFLMKYTTFGRALYAVGGNAEAARLCGINVTFVKVMALASTGCLTALSGIILSSRIMSGTPTVAQGWELDAITAVIIGGTSFAGGSGSVFGTLIGVLFIGVVVNGMVLTNVPIYGQYVVRGLLILVAVWLSQVQRRAR